jgi:hypothetical protein
MTAQAKKLFDTVLVVSDHPGRMADWLWSRRIGLPPTANTLQTRWTVLD